MYAVKVQLEWVENFRLYLRKNVTGIRKLLFGQKSKLYEMFSKLVSPQL